MSELWDVPPAWCWTTMGDATDVIGGGTPSTTNPMNFQGSIPWITPADMSGYSDKSISGGARFISEHGFEESGARWLPKGTVLFSSRAPIGYVAIASQSVTTNQGFKSFVPGMGLNSDYVYYWLTSAKRHAEALASGTTFLELSGAKAALIPIPVAPEGEQTRIVAKLEELLSDLDAGVAELKAAQKKLAQYRQSLLKAAVEGALTAAWRAARAPLPPRGGGAGGEGANTPATDDEPWLQARARELRQQQTPDEQALWQQLRAKRFSGHKFRRQQVLGRFIVDFVCFAKRLIVELDGGQHAEAVDHDNRRDAWLERQGFRVLRFWNNEWSQQPEAVLDSIWQALQQAPPLPNPSPARGEGLPEPESGAQLLQRILVERRARWEAKQLAKFKEQGKAPPKDWQKKYPEPVQPDITGLPELPEGWVWSSLGQCFHVAVGATPSRKEPSYWGGSIPWVSSGEVRFSRIATTKEMITQDGFNNSSTQINPVGSVLLGLIGEGKTRGQVAILDVEAANNQNCAAIWASEAGVLSEYVYFWLWSQYEKTRRGSSGNNQPALNKSIVERISFPLAPLDEMDEIVRLVSQTLDAISEQEMAIEISLKQSTAQRQNILRAAFAGQLVPQDPNDEPASVLLERIRAERAERDAVKKPRGRKAREAT